MSTPFDPNEYVVTDAPPPDHVVPDHHAKAEPERKLVPPWKRERDTGRGKPLPKEKKPVPAYHEGMFVEPMEEFYASMAFALMPFRPKVSAYLMMPEIIVKDGEQLEGRTGARRCAEAWDAAAKQSESVRRFLNGFLTVSIWGALVTAHMPIVVGMMERGDGENPFAMFENAFNGKANGGGHE